MTWWRRFWLACGTTGALRVTGVEVREVPTTRTMGEEDTGAMKPTKCKRSKYVGLIARREWLSHRRGRPPNLTVDGKIELLQKYLRAVMGGAGYKITLRRVKRTKRRR